MRESTARGSASTSFSSNTRRLLAVYAIASLPLLANAAAGNYAYFTDRDSGGGVSAINTYTLHASSYETPTFFFLQALVSSA